ncbi:CAP domain-containing protein [Spirilliplanes yamanashiensis]|uniref:SCP domain-containing protein n=1 Tax=Spirilliplanes yamanashiensis TaxID=42233 RepID=A0A8J3Y4V8_9ACTN|nr:CAP domain-containing protein [Spirilliplanes yamanashiensis]MDP9819731.1 uncharacterized protein YkwD [Spirilliplanes yamanashiensis]GIJ01449.1 hypothetical protein Sya03_08010 [Spirilliplanes yamanashiensis]
MYGHVEPTDETTGRPVTGRHRDRHLLSAPLALGLTVAALLTAFGVGAALLPERVTGKGVAAEQAPRADLLADVPGGPAGGAGGEQPGTDPGADPGAAPGADPSAAAPAASGAAPSAPAPAKTTAAPRPKAAPAKPKPKPRPTKTTSKPRPVGSDMLSQENEVIRLANVERRKAGCGTVRMDTKLRQAMRKHVQELGTHGGLYISHDSDDGRSFVDRARAEGYTAPGGENVARGQRNAADVMNSWMNSDGHRANILNCSFKAIGVGVVKGVDNTLVWGQIFGRE